MRQERIEIKDDAVGIVAPVYAVEMPMTAMVMLYSHTFFNLNVKILCFAMPRRTLRSG